MIHSLEFIISKYNSEEEIISDNGKQHSLTVTRDIENIGSLLKKQKYAGHDAHAKELPPLLLQQPVWLQKAAN